MNAHHRKALLEILWRVDQLQADAEDALAEPLDTADTFRLEIVREILADMQETVGKYLNQKVDK